jgi:hypothetical protein
LIYFNSPFLCLVGELSDGVLSFIEGIIGSSSFVDVAVSSAKVADTVFSDVGRSLV